MILYFVEHFKFIDGLGEEDKTVQTELFWNKGIGNLSINIGIGVQLFF
jgi:hypothetical protein